MAGKSGGKTTAPTPTPSPSAGFALKEAYGSIEVSAQTDGKLYLNGKFMGNIPAGREATLNSISVGRHNLEMRYGSKTESQTIQVQEGRTAYWPLATATPRLYRTALCT